MSKKINSNETQIFVGKNLKLADLSFGDFSGCDFTGADLTGADLSFGDFYGAKFNGCNLSGANLVNARLAEVQACKADLTDACLDGTNLWCAELSGSNFKNAEATHAVMCGAKLINASLDGAELVGANLASADLTGCEMSGVFGETILCNIDLYNTKKLGYARITDANYIDHITIEKSARTLSSSDSHLDALVRFLEESRVGGGAIAYLRRLAASGKTLRVGELNVSSGYSWVTTTLPQWAVRWDLDMAPSIEGLRALLARRDASEREMQAFLQNHPALLAKYLHGGHGRWVIPNLQLGSSHVADFVLGEKDSTGHHWMFVELESPAEKLFTKDGDPANMLKHAIRQIQDWRTWFESNLLVARGAAEEGGMGLFDIEAESEGLIVIGRRSELSARDRLRRRRMSRENRIHIHTYDYLLDLALGPGQRVAEHDD